MSSTFQLDSPPALLTSALLVSGNFPEAVIAERPGVEDLLLGSLQHPLVRLRRELRLKVRRSGGSIAVAWDDAELSVEASTFSTAIERFCRAAAEQFIALKKAGPLPTIFADAMRDDRI